MGDLKTKFDNTYVALYEWDLYSFGRVRKVRLQRELDYLRANPLRVGPTREANVIEDQMVEHCFR